MSGTVGVLHGPFESEAEFQAFKFAREDEGAAIGRPVRVDREMHGGVIFARVVSLVAVASPPPTLPDLPTNPPAPALNEPKVVAAGAPGPFVSARRTGALTVVYLDAEGRDLVREGGSRSWRNNNPGNIVRGTFTLAAGAIGDDGSFAIFPDERTGLAAVETLLRSASYASLSIHDAIFRYAPPSENDSEAYVRFVTRETGLDAGRRLGELNKTEMRAFAQAIKKMEGWTVGTERSNAPSSGMRALTAGAVAGISGAGAAAREWLDVAEREAGLPERERSSWTGAATNPRIMRYFEVAASWFNPDDGDETDWCAAFVNFCLIEAGYHGTDHPGARSFFWNKAGRFVPLQGPSVGAVAVRRYAPFTDPAWTTGPGHVGFVVNSNATTLTLLGGNQGDTVRLQTFPRREVRSDGSVASEFVAFMMPTMN